MKATHLAAVLTSVVVVVATARAEDRSKYSSGTRYTAPTPTRTPTPTTTTTPTRTPTTTTTPTTPTTPVVQPAQSGLTAAQCLGCHAPQCTDPLDSCPPLVARHHALAAQGKYDCIGCHGAPSPEFPRFRDCPSCHNPDGPAKGYPHDPSTHQKWFAQQDYNSNPGVQPQNLITVPPGCSTVGPVPTCGWDGSPTLTNSNWATTPAGFWSTATGYDLLPSGAQAQWRFCFRCHSSAGFGGKGMTAPSGLPFTDIAREFNPANMVISGSGGISSGGGDDGGSKYTTSRSFTGISASVSSVGTIAGGAHPIVSPVTNDLGHTNNIGNGLTVNSMIRCSDCHAVNQTSAGLRIGLKGPNTRWDANVTIGNNSGAFCFNCHNAFGSGGDDDSNNRIGTKALVHVEERGEHSGLQCWACHPRIPHGGPRPLIIASAGASAAVGGVIPGWDQSPPYAMMGSIIAGSGGSDEGRGGRFYIKSYPPQGQPFDKGNCGCNGTEHD